MGKMESLNTKNGLEELRQLCKKIIDIEQCHDLRERENTEKRQVRQVVQKQLRELQISVALVQLDLIAPHELTDKVNSLTIDGNTKGLRHLILELVSDLERYLSGRDRTRPDMDFIERSVKTLCILIELLDSLESSLLKS
jgi:hypothetical protein